MLAELQRVYEQMVGFDPYPADCSDYDADLIDDAICEPDYVSRDRFEYIDQEH